MNESAETLFKKIKLSVSKKINTRFAGQYRSAFKGNGLQFENVREYQYGDEVKTIDWNVSARMNHLYVKEYMEERELNIVLMIDISGSMEYGGGKTKNEILLEVATVLLFLAQYNNDRISVLLFTDKVEYYFTPKKGRKYVLKVLNDIMTMKPKSRKTDISAAVDFCSNMLKKRSVIFILSDFIDENYGIKLKRLKRLHDVIPVKITDPSEKKFRFFGLTQFTDMETGQTFYSTKSSFLKDEIWGFDILELSTVEPVENSILKFFETRNRKKISRW